VARAECIEGCKPGVNELVLPVGVVEPAVRVIAERLSAQMIKERLHAVSLYDPGEPRVIVDQKLSLKMFFKQIG